MRPDQSVISAHVNALTNKHGGTITPDIVWRAAKNPRDPLHECFNWDVQSAAEEHWREVARSLIRSVRVEITTTNIKLTSVAYVRDPRLTDRQGYLPVATLRSDKDLAREALVQEFSRAASYLRRARELAAVFGIESKVENVQKRLTALTEEVNQLS